MGKSAVLNHKPRRGNTTSRHSMGAGTKTTKHFHGWFHKLWTRGFGNPQIFMITLSAWNSSSSHIQVLNAKMLLSRFQPQDFSGRRFLKSIHSQNGNVKLEKDECLTRLKSPEIYNSMSCLRFLRNRVIYPQLSISLSMSEWSDFNTITKITPVNWLVFQPSDKSNGVGPSPGKGTQRLPAPALRRSASCGNTQRPMPVLIMEYTNLTGGGWNELKWTSKTPVDLVIFVFVLWKKGTKTGATSLTDFG